MLGLATLGTSARIFLRRSYEQPDAHGVSSNSSLPWLGLGLGLGTTLS